MAYQRRRSGGPGDVRRDGLEGELEDYATLVAMGILGGGLQRNGLVAERAIEGGHFRLLSAPSWRFGGHLRRRP
jgi:hypothetical protein